MDLHIGNWQDAVHSASAWTFTAVLCIVFPALDWAIYVRSKSTLAIYIWIILAEWSLVAACLWVAESERLSVFDVGENLRNPLRIFIASGVLVAVVMAVIIVGRNTKSDAKSVRVSRAASEFRKMFPVNRTQRSVFIVVALTAGVCEEFLYRGWLLNLTGAALGSLWAGVLVSSIVFGLAHAYQGRTGIVSSGVLGVVFCGIFLFSGSLIPGQLLHTIIDVNNGLVLGKMASHINNE